MIYCSNSFVPFTSAQYPVTQPISQTVAQPQTKEVEEPKKSSDNKLIWAGLAGLAILGTYLLTKGHCKSGLSSATQSTERAVTQSAEQAATQSTERVVTQSAEQAAAQTTDSINEFLAKYEPFDGAANLAENVKPKITRIGSRTRAEFVNIEHVDTGYDVTRRDIVIFNKDGRAVSRFSETVSPNPNNNGEVRFRSTYRLNDKGEQQLVQRSTMKSGDVIFKKGGVSEPRNARSKTIDINNLNVHESPKELADGINIDPNSNVRHVNIRRTFNKSTNRLVEYNAQRSYLNSEGDVLPMFYKQKVYGYDKAGNLIGVLEKNPTNRLNGGKLDYLYSNINNGQVVSSHPASSDDFIVLYQKGQYNQPDGTVINHTMTDEEIAKFADYFSSKNQLAS
jgi:hypothetical protein